MSAVLAPDVADRLAKILERCGSPFENERAIAAEKATRVVRGLDKSWSDILCPPRPAPVPPRPPQRPILDPQRLAAWCLGAPQCLHLTRRERDFLTNVSGWRGALTRKQILWIQTIAFRIEAAVEESGR